MILRSTWRDHLTKKINIDDIQYAHISSSLQIHQIILKQTYFPMILHSETSWTWALRWGTHRWVIAGDLGDSHWHLDNRTSQSHTKLTTCKRCLRSRGQWIDLKHGIPDIYNIVIESSLMPVITVHVYAHDLPRLQLYSRYPAVSFWLLATHPTGAASKRNCPRMSPAIQIIGNIFPPIDAAIDINSSPLPTIVGRT